jgi:MoaA/NifB/PqqE/SkfB family radical SAM enzyme
VEKLLLYPKKLESLLRWGPERPDPLFPISVELSLTNKCNLNCVYCSDSEVRKWPDFFHLSELDDLFGELAAGGTRGVTFEGGGEPLLATLNSHSRTGIFWKALVSCLKHGLSPGLITNGLLLFTETAPAELLPALRWVRVSLDAANETQYKALKGSRGFSKAFGNIERLAKLVPKPVVGAGYVLTNLNDNPAALRILAQRLRDAGADYLQIRPVVDHPELESRRDLAPALSDLSGPGFNVDLAPLSDNLPAGNLGLPCRAHSITAVITADTRIFTCGRLNDRPFFPHIGAMAVEADGEWGFTKSWNGKLRQMQNRVLGRASFCAENCPRCRITKYNRLIDDLLRMRTPDFI